MFAFVLFCCSELRRNQNKIKKLKITVLFPSTSSHSTLLDTSPSQDQSPSPRFDQFYIYSPSHPQEHPLWHRISPTLPLVCRPMAHQTSNRQNERLEYTTNDSRRSPLHDLSNLIQPTNTPAETEVGELIVWWDRNCCASCFVVTQGIDL